MPNKEIIIRIDNDRVYFNSHIFISIRETNIPHQYLSFRNHQPIFWKVEMLEYTGTGNCLKVRVLQYQWQELSYFHKQEPKKIIRRLLFEKFDWACLEPLLSSYQKINLSNILTHLDANQFSDEAPPHVSRAKLEPFTASSESPAEIRKTIETEFWMNISDISFRLGYVSFSKRIDRVDNAEIEFRIVNEHILAEFDSIKFWFSKILKTKKIKVRATITALGNDVIETLATSAHIDQISPELIDSVKYLRTRAMLKAPEIKMPDKSLFTSEDIFSQFESEDTGGNLFGQTDTDLLSFLSARSNIRNRAQLQYLAGARQAERHKLRYTLHPNFGFLFFIEGMQHNHFVWELLNSHATYIWSIGKSDQDIEMQYRRIESTINNIRSSGREDYRRSYRSCHVDEDLIFNMIEHDQINSHLKDGFLKWKNRLNEMLS